MPVDARVPAGPSRCRQRDDARTSRPRSLASSATLARRTSPSSKYPNHCRSCEGLGGRGVGREPDIRDRTGPHGQRTRFRHDPCARAAETGGGGFDRSFRWTQADVFWVFTARCDRSICGSEQDLLRRSSLAVSPRGTVKRAGRQLATRSAPSGPTGRHQAEWSSSPGGPCAAEKGIGHCRARRRLAVDARQVRTTVELGARRRSALRSRLPPRARWMGRADAGCGTDRTGIALDFNEPAARPQAVAPGTRGTAPARVTGQEWCYGVRGDRGSGLHHGARARAAHLDD
jgi:hypothetical protein